jgi:hypothetical protein
MTTFRSDRSADDHAGHDRPLVVAYACGDLDADDARAARAVIDGCRSCAALARDVSLLQAFVATDLGAPRRQRDFRLSADDADRLRAGPVTRLLRRLGGPGMALLQPLAGAALAIGLVLVVAIGVVPSLRLGAGGAVPALGPASDSRAGTSAEDAAGGRNGSSPVPAALATAAPEENQFGQAGVIDTPTQPTKSLAAPPTPGPDPGLLGGLVLVVAGGAVLVVRLAARRIAEDPLLR